MMSSATSSVASDLAGAEMLGALMPAPKRLAAAGIGGGATYDGLIALTAIEHDLELLSRDRRAARTYGALGARFQLIA